MPHAYGLIKDKPDNRDFTYTAYLMMPQAALPAFVDLTQYYPPIMDQGQIGSCTGNSASSVVKYSLNKLAGTNFKTIPSRLFIYDNGKLADGLDVTKDSGCSVRGVLKGLARYFSCDELDYQYSLANALRKPPPAAYAAALKYKYFQYYRVPQSLIAVKKSIADGYPVILGIAIYESFEDSKSLETGLIPMPDTSKEKLLGYHCVNLCGYDDKGKMFLMCNSWGTDIGLVKKPGYFKLPYAFVLNNNLSSDLWRIAVSC